MTGAPSSDRLPAAALVLALALAALARLHNIAEPFGRGFDGWLGAMHGNAARQLDREGIVALRGLPYLEPGPLARADAFPHVHHPPLLHVANALVVRIFGPSEWALRLFPSLATLAAIALFFALARRICDARTAGLAAIVLACLPMTIAYGGLVNYEPVVLATSAGAVLAYLRWRERGRARDLALLAGAIVLGILFDWFGAFAAAPIALHALFVRPRAPRFFVPLLALLAIATAAGVLAYYEHVRPGALAELARQARYRTGSAASDAGGESFSAAGWLAREWGALRRLFGLAPLALAILGPLLAAGGRSAGLRRGALFTVLLAPIGVLAMATFPQASYTHEFLGYPLSLAVALGAALVPGALAARFSGRCAAIAGLAVVAVSCAFGVRAGFRCLDAWHGDWAYARLGRAIAEATPPEWTVATPGTDMNVWTCAGFYADRALVTGVRSIEDVDRLRRAPAGPGRRAPVRFVVFTAPLLESHGDLAGALAERGAAVAGRGPIVLFDLGPH
jgi:4-amino-4-deoxy-L-arabinose transferase-like glycosyltransferase